MQSIYNSIAHEQCANMLATMSKNGISVIPLQGKRPHFSIKWKQYQYVRPAPETINYWANQSISSYGIICGRVSQGIVVIDFDCTALYQQFIEHFPALKRTYTVKTRRGFHLYVKTTFPVPPRQFRKCDIKGDGGYVVGAGSVVDGYCYTIHIQAEIMSIDYKTYQSILDWFSPSVEQLELPPPATYTFDMVSRYTKRAPEQGRNNALFATSIEARQHHIPMQEVIQTLATKHALMPSPINHRRETPTQRLQEALRTIKSAYRSSQKMYKINSGLSNSIRESLLKIQSSTVTVRILDAIHLVKKNGWITLKHLLKIAGQFHIARKSVLNVLTGNLARINGKRIFKQIPYQDHIASYVSQGDSWEPNSTYGRPTQFIYLIPTDEYLAEILHVERSISDNLQPEDLYSAGAYRRALHRELIRRLSPIIRVSWYANRLGVHRRTIFRYNVQLGVIATPMIQKEILTQEDIQTLPDNDSSIHKGFTPGRWLEIAGGKRFPALKSIANNLVSKIKSLVSLCRQLPSRYTLTPNKIDEAYPIQLPDHLKSRGKLLTHNTIHEILSPDWATKKFDLGGYLAVYNGYEWTFRPPLRVIAYQLVKHYEDGLVYFIKPLKV